MDGRNEWGEETTAEREIKRASGAARGPSLVHSAPLTVPRPPEENSKEGDGGMKEGWNHHASPSACYPPPPPFSPTSSTTTTASVRRLLRRILLQFNFSLKISLPPHLPLSPVPTSSPSPLSQFAVQALFPPGPLAARPTKAALKSRVILHFSASHARQRIRAL